jgi:hypothetical protein
MGRKLSEAYEESKFHRENGIMMNSHFVNSLKVMYKDFSPETLKADIATAYCNHTTNSDKINYAIDLMNFIDTYNTKQSDYNNSLIVNKYEDSNSSTTYEHNTPLAGTIYQALSNVPFVCVRAKSNVPILPSLVSELHELNEELAANASDDFSSNASSDGLSYDEDEDDSTAATYFDAKKKKHRKKKSKKGRARSSNKGKGNVDWMEESGPKTNPPSEGRTIGEDDEEYGELERGKGKKGKGKQDIDIDDSVFI